jgi:hypothetical protein
MNEELIKQFDKLVDMLGYNRLRSDNMPNNEDILEEFIEMLEGWNGEETYIQDECIFVNGQKGINVIK